MSIGLLLSLGLLGLSAVDPVGIAAMPLLLTQKNPFARSLLFLGGSFTALMVMGLLFAQGFGTVVVRFEATRSWLVPGIEVAAGVVLLGIAGTLLWRMKTSRLSVEKPSDAIVKRLQLGNGQLFLFGAGLVAVQSIVDVVFVVAMIHAGQLHLSGFALVTAVGTYAVTALVLQLAVVMAYWITPRKQRAQTLGKVHHLLTRYANQTIMTISLLLGCALLANGALALAGAPHF